MDGDGLIREVALERRLLRTLVDLEVGLGLLARLVLVPEDALDGGPVTA